MVCEMGSQVEVTDESGKTNNVNVQDIKVTYPVDGLIKMFT